MKDSKLKKSSRVILFFISVVVLVFTAGLYVTFTKINYSYQPYITDHIAMVFKNGDGSTTVSSEEFILTDVKELEGRGRKATIVNGYHNKNKNIDLLVKNSDSVYIDLFDNVSTVENFDNSYPITTPLEIKSQISPDTNLAMVYDKRNQRLNLVLRGQRLAINDERILLNDYLVFSVGGIESNSFLRVGELIVDLSRYQNDATITLSDIVQNGIAEFKLATNNLLKDQNYSFEQGLWHDRVADCSAYLGGEPDIAFGLTTDATDGSQALRLTSGDHSACTLQSFNIALDRDNLYKLSFDYKNLSGRKVQYYYDLRNKLDQVQEKFGSFVADNSSWHTFSTIIEPEIVDAYMLSVYLYAPSDGSVRVTNIFDNVKLATFVLDQKISLPPELTQQNISLANWVKLQNGQNTFRYSQEKSNLLKDLNYSFEQGLWSEQAVDCSDYLSDEAEFKVSNDTDASSGKKSLLISSENHFACMFNSFPVVMKNDTLYQLSFDFKNLEGNKVQYYYNFTNQYNQSEEGFDTYEHTSGQWQTGQVLINPKIVDPTNFVFYVYAASDGSSTVTNLYDNIRLEEIAPTEIYSYFLYAGQDVKKVKQYDQLSFNSSNRWRDTITLKNAHGSFLLVYPRQYDDNWSLVVGKKRISDELHYQVNGANNAWWLTIEDMCSNNNCQQNGDGTFNITLVIENNFSKLLLYFRVAIMLSIFGLLITTWYVWKK